MVILGFYWLLMRPKLRGGPLSEYLKRPLTIVSIALLLAALMGFAHNLGALYGKHFR